MSASIPPPSLHGSQQSDGLGYTASMVSAFVLSAAALWLMELGSTTLVLLTAGFALLLSRQQRARDAVDQRLGLAAELELASTLLQRGAHGDALAIAGRVAEHARTPRLQRAALELLAWSHLGLGRPQAARDALSWVRSPEELDPLCCAAVEDACGESLWALHLLENSARRRRLSREGILFLIDLNARLRGIEAACRLTLSELSQLTLDDARRVLEFAGSAGSAGSAGGDAVSALAEALRLREASARV